MIQSALVTRILEVKNTNQTIDKASGYIDGLPDCYFLALHVREGNKSKVYVGYARRHTTDSVITLSATTARISAQGKVEGIDVVTPSQRYEFQHTDVLGYFVAVYKKDNTPVMLDKRK
ncbi:MAG: hypothetical protein ACI8Y7_000578 [Candidatus Woesearchaeota archaeon]|jgi:hypothetical protein